jgi:hypothetical protein
MEETIITPLPEYKLYKDRTIAIGTFLGGPLVGGYLAAENFKHLGQSGNVRTTWVVAIIATVAIFGAVFYIPGVQRIPNYIIPILYTGITQYLVQRYQGNAIKEHMEKGGQIYSPWRAVWIGLIGAVVLVAIVVIFILATDRNSLI